MISSDNKKILKIPQIYLFVKVEWAIAGAAELYICVETIWVETCHLFLLHNSVQGMNAYVIELRIIAVIP